MRSMPSLVLSRRKVLAGTGALVMSFASAPSLLLRATEGQGSPPLPGSLKQSPYLDSWIRIAADGRITVLTGKVELGQGVKTALLQIAAEELDVPLETITLVTADTGQTANEGFTAGSRSMHDSGTAIQNAAAQVRALLLDQASQQLGVTVDQLRTEAGAVIAPDGTRRSYGELVGAEMLHVEAQPRSVLKDPKGFKVIGKPIPRIDIPAKVTGGTAYVHDLRLPGLLHARVVRPPSYGARLVEVNAAAVEKMPGVVKVVRDGNFLAVVAEREFLAIKAMRALAASARWQETAKLPKQDDFASLLLRLPAQDSVIFEEHGAPAAAGKKLEASFTRAYQMHASIGPACAVAKLEDGTLTVWTHTQGVYPDRAAIAQMLHLPPERVRCIHMEGAGCYGHNGADDAAADAALIARALPGRPVRVQWMREQEHAWEPYGPAMVGKARAALDANGRVANWEYEVWSNTHSTRPGGAGSLLAARDFGEAFAEPAPKPLPLPDGGGDRNAIPLYKFPNARVVHHFIPTMPVRVSALRALGAYVNVFSIETFMDELAQAAGVDPVEFRLQYLEDARARDVISVAAERFGWTSAKALPRGRGRGFGFSRYKNYAAYCAVAMEVEVARESGRVRPIRAVAAVDSGQVINPDGLVNQVEGAIIQSMSWTLYERVSFDERRITSIDWSTYPIMRFDAVPESIDVHVIDRPGQRFLGSGECGQGPAAAALGNAIANAIGQRLRDLPLSRDRIKAAMPV
ncbi:MAG: molybdopterin cofactor-binding domain-containing protein [Xanthobacteraceae bacterium]